MWVTKLLISLVKIRIFCPRATKFGPKLAFLVNLGQALPSYMVPYWWVGWWLWRAGCISQDTYLLYLLLTSFQIFRFYFALNGVPRLDHHGQGIDYTLHCTWHSAQQYFHSSIQILVKPCLLLYHPFCIREGVKKIDFF